MKLWEGLGYYNRVRNMQKAAVTVTEEYDGVLPADYGKLLELKGIGSYTAGAIASIAYGIPVPAVDGNVLRILTRVAADDTDIMKQSFRSAVEAQLGEMMRELTVPEELRRALRDENVPGALNQAMMELGATVCVPNGAPLCEECPWSKMCLARAQGRVMDFPVKSKAKARRIEERTVLVIRDGEKVAIRTFQPQLANIMDEMAPSFYTEQEKEVVGRLFPTCEKISIDYAVMEKSKEIYTLPAEFGWSDLGSWGSLRTLLPQDEDGNAKVGKDIRLYECKNCVVHAADESKVVVQGLDGYIVAEKHGQLLVCSLKEEQRIKEFGK